MSWFDSKGWASLAKTALSNAQKTIDQALDIKESQAHTSFSNPVLQKEKEDTVEAFFSSFGVGSLIGDRNKSPKKKVDAKSPEDDSASKSWTKWKLDSEAISKASKQFENDVVDSKMKREGEEELKTTTSAKTETVALPKKDTTTSPEEEAMILPNKYSVDKSLKENERSVSSATTSDNVTCTDENLNNPDDICASVTSNGTFEETDNTVMKTTPVEGEILKVETSTTDDSKTCESITIFEKTDSDFNKVNATCSLDSQMESHSGRLDYQIQELIPLMDEENSLNNMAGGGQWEADLDLTTSTLSLMTSEQELRTCEIDCSDMREYSEKSRIDENIMEYVLTAEENRLKFDIDISKTKNILCEPKIDSNLPETENFPEADENVLESVESAPKLDLNILKSEKMIIDCIPKAEENVPKDDGSLPEAGESVDVVKTNGTFSENSGIISNTEVPVGAKNDFSESTCDKQFDQDAEQSSSSIKLNVSSQQHVEVNNVGDHIVWSNANQTCSPEIDSCSADDNVNTLVINKHFEKYNEIVEDPVDDFNCDNSRLQEADNIDPVGSEEKVIGSSLHDCPMLKADESAIKNNYDCIQKEDASSSNTEPVLPDKRQSCNSLESPMKPQGFVREPSVLSEESAKINILQREHARSDEIAANVMPSIVSEKVLESAVSTEEGEIQTSSDTLVLSEEENSENVTCPTPLNICCDDKSTTPQNLSICDKNDTEADCSEKKVGSTISTANITESSSSDFTQTFIPQELDTASGMLGYSIEKSDNQVIANDLLESKCNIVETSGQTSVDETDHQSESSHSSSSSLSSFVKFSNDDALKTMNSSTTSHSCSDILKIDVEMLSGHTSGDEVETTTSSDIEIISSPNDGSSSVSGRDSRSSTSPGKQMPNVPSLVCKEVQDKMCYPGSIIQSSEMVSSISACEISNCMKKIPSQSKHSNISSSGAKLKTNQAGLKKRRNSDTSSEEMDSVRPSKAFIKKIADMTAVIDAREAKLLELSKENVLIKETNMELQEQYQQLEDKHSSCSLEVAKVSPNLAEKLKLAEQKLIDALHEKNEFEKKFRSAKEEVARRLRHEEVQSILQEKEQQIHELLSEGEKLSKQQLQHSNVIKKLRAKDKETEETLQKTKESLNEKVKELEAIRKSLELKDESEKQRSDITKQLTAENQHLQKEFKQCQSDLEDANEKARAMKSTLDNSYKEIAELHKLNILKDNQIEEAVLSADLTVKEKLKDAIGEVEKNASEQRESLILQIEELQLTHIKIEKKAKYREEMLQHEIDNLQERLQTSECHNDEVSQNISAATRPLLRQIENLQSTFKAQSKSAEAVERNLTERLIEAQRQLAVATEKEKVATERYMEVSSRTSTLESQNASLHREKSALNSTVDVEKSKVCMLEDSKAKAISQIDIVKKGFADEITALKKSKNESEMEAAVMREKYEAEQKQVQFLQEQLDREKSSSIMMSESLNYSSGANTPTSMSRISLVSDNNWLQDESMSQSMFSLNFNQGNKMSVYETLRSGGNTSSLIENLQSQLKQREGEIAHLQNDMGNMDKIRESMSQELVRLSTSNDKLQDELDASNKIKENFRVMEGQYNALLQMYGEKIEETEELKLDLQDVKDMYKIQIDQLLQQKT